MAIKKVLQDKRYKNRELQTMRLLDHPNVVSLKHCFFSTTEKDELYLNLVLEYVPETVHRVIKHYNKLNQRMPLIYVKLYTYQVILLSRMWFLFSSIGCVSENAKCSKGVENLDNFAVGNLLRKILLESKGMGLMSYTMDCKP